MSEKKRLSHRSRLFQTLGHPDGYLVGVQEEEPVPSKEEYKKAQEDVDLMKSFGVRRKKRS
tara:strand:+ start:1305 stop:1487 length:183 start_codon:yes stop_codon:yes gene_type:complete